MPCTDSGHGKPSSGTQCNICNFATEQKALEMTRCARSALGLSMTRTISGEQVVRDCLLRTFQKELLQQGMTCQLPTCPRVFGLRPQCPCFGFPRPEYISCKICQSLRLVAHPALQAPKCAKTRACQDPGGFNLQVFSLGQHSWKAQQITTAKNTRPERTVGPDGAPSTILAMSPPGPAWRPSCGKAGRVSPS